MFSALLIAATYYSTNSVSDSATNQWYAYPKPSYAERNGQPIDVFPADGWSTGRPVSEGKDFDAIGIPEPDKKNAGDMWTERLTDEEIINLFVRDELTFPKPDYEMTRAVYSFTEIEKLSVDEKATLVWRSWELRRGCKKSYDWEIKRINANEKMKEKPDMRNVSLRYPKYHQFCKDFPKGDKCIRMKTWLSSRSVTMEEFKKYMDEKTGKTLNSIIGQLVLRRKRAEGKESKRNVERNAKREGEDERRSGPPTKPFRVNKKK